MSAEDEAFLIAKVRDGDDLAYEQLLRPLIQPAHKLACGLLHDSHLAEDAVQDPAVKAWRKLANLRPGAPMRPWFLGIVVNECREVRRGHWARLAPRQSGSGGVHESADDAAIQRIEIRLALERLDRRERVIVVLHYYVQLSWPEITAVTGLSESAAQSRLYRAISRLRAANAFLVAT
jgi:RNA polymerase sigma-70 factor (ECF subfamily)